MNEAYKFTPKQVNKDNLRVMGSTAIPNYESGEVPTNQYHEIVPETLRPEIITELDAAFDRNDLFLTDLLKVDQVVLNQAYKVLNGTTVSQYKERKQIIDQIIGLVEAALEAAEE